MKTIKVDLKMQTKTYFANMLFSFLYFMPWKAKYIGYVFFLFYSFFPHTIHPDYSFLSLPPPSLPLTFLLLFQIHYYSISLQKRTKLPMISIKHVITECNKIGTKPHVRGIPFHYSESHKLPS